MSTIVVALYTVDLPGIVDEMRSFAGQEPGSRPVVGSGEIRRISRWFPAQWISTALLDILTEKIGAHD